MTGRRRTLAAAAVVLTMASQSYAQQLQPELRVDVLGPSPYSVQPGAGAIIALGYYARVGATIGYGVNPDRTLIDDRWRADLLVRATLDPFRQQRWGFAIGGGLSVRRRTYLAAIVDLEGQEVAGFLPALQLGFSGGFRGGLMLRRARKGRR